MGAPIRRASTTARTTRPARWPRASRTRRSPPRRSPAARSPGPRTPRTADSAAPRRRACRCPATSRLEVVRVLGQVLGAVLGHEHQVLQADTAVALPVEAGLDRDDVAGDELLVGDEAEVRLLVHLEPDSVAEPVEEPVGERLACLLRALRGLARGLEDLARAVEDRLAVRTRADLGDRAIERLLAQPVPG